jgi:hypothetical protein
MRSIACALMLGASVAQQKSVYNNLRHLNQPTIDPPAVGADAPVQPLTKVPAKDREAVPKELPFCQPKAKKKVSKPSKSSPATKSGVTVPKAEPKPTKKACKPKIEMIDRFFIAIDKDKDNKLSTKELTSVFYSFKDKKHSSKTVGPK